MREADAARSALDATGRFLLSASTDGTVRWATPQAARLLHGLSPAADASDFKLPRPVRDWLSQTRDAADPRSHLWAEGEHRVEFAYLGRLKGDEHLLRVGRAAVVDEADLLRHEFSLTAREAKVLLWIARGKSNKGISGVLQISPRTVNKHLEQVFEKLGVEIRASAAALTVRALHRHT